MSARDLNRLERLLGGILLAGVALSATALIAGLLLMAMGSPGAGFALTTGLVLLMCIPAARILASFGDAVVRRDGLLAAATAFVSLVLLWQFLKTLQ
ncbi:MAG: DUF1634 domain-containing protein [Acidobacteria bacterium]|nr:MAG: DUF1634 domain-containing protein [Acidobacteriota bacterium]